MNQLTTFDPTQIDRPDKSLLKYYAITCLLIGPLAPIAFIPMWIRFATLRYKFDAEGISMCWGVLFRREIYLTYKRIQDIHLTRNILQRWMNLATISVQTASGKAEAEMAIEGILQADELRNFLYSRMRGAKDHHAPIAATTHDDSSASNDESQRATRALEEIRDALQKLVDQKHVHGA
ncbi:MAG: PH domain-containing protein [Pirellulales bacterium]